jgi:putative transposase
MKKRFTEEEILEFLKEFEGGVPVSKLYKQHGFSECSIYTWREKISDVEIPESRRRSDSKKANKQLRKRRKEDTSDRDALFRGVKLRC